MSGFQRKAKSLAGRPIKPTSKIRAMLGASLDLAFEDAVYAVQAVEKKIRQSMQNGEAERVVRRELKELQSKHTELVQVLDEMRNFVDDDDFEPYRVEFLGVADICMHLEEDIMAYCETEPPPPPTETKPPPPVKTEVDEKREQLAEVLQQTLQLKNEIAGIEEELSRDLGLISKPTRSQPTKSSTPKDGATGVPVTGQLDTSTVPSSISQVRTRRLATPSADPTADAIERLASVLEARNTSRVDQPASGRLPKVEPDVFKGDLISFPAWWNAFETMIESRSRSESEKLFYLSKYTTGPAHESIKGFLSLYGDDTSYRKARNVIVSRFDNGLKIAEAFKLQLNKWSCMKEGDGVNLQRYSDFLWQCHSAMGSLDYLTNLDCREENIKMAAKLPRVISQRWDRIVDEAVYGEDEPDLTADSDGLVGRFPTFHEFCRFVAKEARILDGAVTKPPTSNSSHGAGKKAGVFATKAQESASKEKRGEQVCGYCKGAHMLYQCQDFLGMNVEFKKEYAVARGLCFGCLRSTHIFRNCRIRNPEIMKDHVQPPKATTLRVDAGSDGSSSMIIPVWCSFDENEEHRVLVYAMLDTQSSGCFMSEELADKLQLEPSRVTLELTTLGNKRLVRCGAVDGLRICGENAGENIALPRCYTRQAIPGNLEHVPRPELVAEWPHLRDVAGELSEPCEQVPFGLLIGFNCSEAFCLEDFRRGERQQPFAWKTALGWSVAGKLKRDGEGNAACWSFRTGVKEVEVEDIRRVFDSEFEQAERSDRKLSQDDVLFDSLLDQGLRLCEDGHFQVPLPFRQVPEELPDSRPMALQRLKSVQRKMKRDRQFGAKYAEFMNKVITTGQAKAVDKPDQVPIGSRWYWANHGVVHPRKPESVRGVWDGAAQVRGVCINDYLLTGPDRMNNLVGVLFRFRKERVAVACDIEGMFLQIRVEPAHRRYLRFLWFDGGDPDADVLEYELTVLPFGAASSPGCAVKVLNATADRFEGQFGADAASFIRDNFYVDDGLGSVADDESALELVHNSRGICGAGGFNLRKFACSSRAVMDKIPDDWRSRSLKELNLTQENMPDERVLGLILSMEKDAFLYSVQMLSKADTRRGYLSALSSLFDPMGLVSPALLPGRLLLQELCSRKFEWDEAVEDSVREAWTTWYAQLAALNGLQIERCLRRTVEHPIGRAELHVFSDASDYGYGACCYLLLANDSGAMDTTLIFAKSKVGPKKAVTIPRLELQAAVLGVKMGGFVAEELGYKGLRSYYWTDSTVVLGYITNEAKRFHVYVANRTQLIRTRTSADQWRHVVTDRNPADIASRGVESGELLGNKLWWHGPTELMASVEDVTTAVAEIDDADPEVRRATVALATATHEEPCSRARWIVSQYSSWRKCVAVAAQCLRFVDLLRRRARPEGALCRSPVSYQAGAVEWLVAAAQQMTYPAEIAALRLRGSEQAAPRGARKAVTSGSNLFRLDVYLDGNGVLRVGGRLRLSGWPRRMIHPMVLPGEGELAERLIIYYHGMSQHQGAVTTLNLLRQSGFWLIGGRSSVSRWVLKCVTCRRKRGQVVQQKMADLPPDRLSVEPPFTYVAADLFGPLMVKRGRTYEKWWVCIFVCMASRPTPCAS